MDENFNHDFAPFVPYGIPTGEKRSILCIMMLHFIYRLYAITMHRRHVKKYKNERIEKI